MNVNSKVKKYIKQVNQKLQEFYKKTNAPKFENPIFTSSVVQERIMRLGIEGKCLDAQTNDELYVVALATLQEDYIKNYQFHGDVCSEIEKLFIKQLDKFSGVFLYMALNTLSLVRADNLEPLHLLLLPFGS